MKDYSHFSLIDEAAPAQLPLWRELFSGVEWWALRFSPVLYGLGTPKGDGSAVIIVPGFMSTDLLYLECRWWLRRIGYKPYASGIGRNMRCLERSGERLAKTLEKAYRDTGRPVHIVGFSLGGILARGLAGLYPERVASVVTVGAPFRAIRVHRYVMGMGDFVRDTIQRFRLGHERHPDCFSGRCTCGLVESLRQGMPDSIPRISIYSRLDGVVDWEACAEKDSSMNREVRGSHLGYSANPQVYREIAKFLAEQQETNESDREDVPKAAPIVPVRDLMSA